MRSNYNVVAAVSVAATAAAAAFKCRLLSFAPTTILVSPLLVEPVAALVTTSRDVQAIGQPFEQIYLPARRVD